MNYKLILLFIPFFGLSCKNKSDILPSNNCHVKEVIIFPGENQLVYKFEYNKSKKINKIFKYNDDYLLKYENIETYKDRIIVKSFQNISRFNNQNDTSKFVYTSYNVYKLNSNNLVSEVDETMKLQYDSKGYIKSYVVETDRRKEINTFKIENNNIVEKYTETFYDGNLRSSETLKLEYDNNFNKNPLSLLHFLSINSMFFMDGYFGKSSKNNLIKAFYIESKNSGNSDKPTIVSIDFNFDDLKNEGNLFFDSIPEAIVKFDCK